jgi:hypothetical protein
MFGNNLTKWLKVGGPSKLQSAQSLQGTALFNACSQKRTYEHKNLIYTLMVSPILEYGAACWVPCREGQINALDRVQKKVAQFTNRTKEFDWETLAQRRTLARLCALFKTNSVERAWKVIRDKLRRAYYVCRFGHVRKIKDRKQRTDLGKYSFVNRTIKNWNQLLAEALGTFRCKPKIFRNRVRKVIIKGLKSKE